MAPAHRPGTSADAPAEPARWVSLAVVIGCAVVALVCLLALLRGRTWAWVPGAVAASVGVRELRALRRRAR